MPPPPARAASRRGGRSGRRGRGGRAARRRDARAFRTRLLGVRVAELLLRLARGLLLLLELELVGEPLLLLALALLLGDGLGGGLGRGGRLLLLERRAPARVLELLLRARLLLARALEPRVVRARAVDEQRDARVLVHLLLLRDLVVLLRHPALLLAALGLLDVVLGLVERVVAPRVEARPELVELVHVLERRAVVAEVGHARLVRPARVAAEDGPIRREEVERVALLLGLVALRDRVVELVRRVVRAPLARVGEHRVRVLDREEDLVLLLLLGRAVLVRMVREQRLVVGLLEHLVVDADAVLVHAEQLVLVQARELLGRDSPRVDNRRGRRVVLGGRVLLARALLRVAERQQRAGNVRCATRLNLDIPELHRPRANMGGGLYLEHRHTPPIAQIDIPNLHGVLAP